MPIARLRGTVEDKGDDWAILTVGGLGILASVPTSAAAALTVGQPASLHTYLHVREDALTLYGFSTQGELHLFEHLISVSGVGPRVALGLLSALDHGQLAAAIVGGRADVLRKVPGVGQKTAERIVLDLRDKVVPPDEAALAGQAALPSEGADPEVVAALVGLGYTPAEATAAAERLPEDGALSLEDRIRLALSAFARS